MSSAAEHHGSAAVGWGYAEPARICGPNGGDDLVGRRGPLPAIALWFVAPLFTAA
jgi:hypothetical protein